MLTTRRGKQFNSMVYGDYESFNHGGRYDVLMNKEDADRLSIAEGERVVLHNGFGVFQGVAKYVDILKGNIEVYFPEGNYLLPRGRYEKYAKIPDYNITVKVEKADRFNAKKDRDYYEKPIKDLEEIPMQ